MPSFGNIIKRTLRVSAWILLSLFLFTIILVYAIRLPAFQTWIVQRAASYLSAELQTTVRLDKIQIEFFRTLSIHGLYVEDQQGDTLLHASEISTIIELFSPGNNKIYLSGVSVIDATFKLQKYKGQKGLNLNFIIEYFDSGKKDTASSVQFDFNPGDIKLENVVFVYRDNRHNDPRDGIDFEDIRLENLHAAISEVRFDADSLYATIDDLKFREKSGFEVEYMEAFAKFTPVSWDFENLLIKTEQTQLLSNLRFDFESIDDFDNFIEKVRITSNFEESTLSSGDLRYFAPELKGMDREINFSGRVRGTISQLRGRELEIRYADNTYFKGDISIAGLPDFEESFFDVLVDDLISDKGDLETIPTFPFTDGKYLQLPDNIRSLGAMRFSGKFTGFLNDFVAYGNLNTDLGYLSSDLNFKLDPEVNRSSYSGHLSVMGFDIGSFTGNKKLLGKTTFKADLNGSGLTLERVNAKMTGLISSLELYGYNYKNIELDGKIAKRLFNGTLSVEEENLSLGFKGSIDLSSSEPVYQFSTEIRNAKLAKLKIIDRDTSSTLSTTASINISGTDFNNLSGFIDLRNTVYRENDKTLELDTIAFQSEKRNGLQFANLRSDVVDFDIQGNYKRSSMIEEALELLASYTPLIPYQKSKVKNPLELTYMVKFKNPDAVLDIFYPELSISKETTLNVELNNVSNRINLKLESDSIKYNDALFEGIGLLTETSGPYLWVRNDVREFSIADTAKIYNSRITGTTNRQQSVISIKTAGKDSLNNRLAARTEINYLSSGKMLIKVLPSVLIADGKKWDIEELNSAIVDSAFIHLNNLEFTHGTESVLLNGTISDKQEDKLHLVLRNFDTSVLNPLFAVYGFNMHGIASGNSEITAVRGDRRITADMNIMNVGVYGDTLGDAFIDFKFRESEKMFTAKALVDRGGSKNIEVEGEYYILNPVDSLDFRFTFEKTNLSSFAGYAKDLVSDVRGKATGTVHLNGPVDDMKLNGKLMLQQASFVVDYLNTRYSLSEEVDFSENYFYFKKFKVNDAFGNQAVVDGYVYHDNLSDWRLQFNINARNFQMLNTNFTQNDLFYGTAYGTGNITISGPLDLIKMNIAARTDRNTQIFIPLSNPEEVSQSSFINFINKGEQLHLEKKPETEISGLEMDFELDVTPDAEIQLIFDSKIGDIIKGRGNGNIKMEITSQGDFRMFGNYEVFSGDYLFTLQNLINKKFIITQGGTIRWSGSPYDAEIDLKAVYKLRASLYDLVQDSSLTNRVPVEVNLHLTESLFNPSINFNIGVPNIDPTAEALVSRYISTDEEKRRQTMSLLVLNRFSPAAGIDNQGSSSSGVSANAAELLSQQLSIWASQITDVVNIGVNYRAADAFNKEELEVALSTRFFKDRVMVDSNVGVSDKNRNTSNIVGDFNVEVKVNQRGSLRFKAFNKTIDNNFLNNYSSPYTQGIGLFYTQEFNTVGEMFRNLFIKNKKKEEEDEDPYM